MIEDQKYMPEDKLCVGNIQVIRFLNQLDGIKVRGELIGKIADTACREREVMQGCPCPCFLS
jgi:hypothetical protein